MIYDERECRKVMRLRGKARYAIWLIMLLALSIVIVSITVLSVHADDGGSCGDNLTYTYSNYTCTLTISGTGAMDNYSPDSSPWKAFKIKIQKIVIEYGVTTIGDWAFYDCRSLTSIAIPESVTSIGCGTFQDCVGLTSVTIPESMTSIGDQAFSDCVGLKSMVIPDGVTSLGRCIFFNCQYLTSVTIPNSVTSIGEHTFYQCYRLTSITIPDSVTTIGMGAFYFCAGLTNVTIPESVTIIEPGAFNNCQGLESITIPNSVTSIGNNAFQDCISLKSIIIPDSITCIETQTFLSCRSLTNVTIPNSVTHISYGAFENCSSLKSIVIPDSVSCIDGGIFRECYLDSVTMPYIENFNEIFDSGLTDIKCVTLLYGVTSIGDKAFSGCSSIRKVVIPNGVTSIGQSAFYDCNNLMSIIIPESVVSIGDCAFKKCGALTSVAIPNGVTSIENETFAYCSSLINITIPDSVTTIGNGAFERCSRLTSISMPMNVTIIGNNAFNGCRELTSLTMPETILTIGSSTFNDCASLTNITIPESVTKIESYAFSGCVSLTNITIPESVVSIGNYAFSGCESITSVNIPNGVTSIGINLFSGCNSLESITIPFVGNNGCFGSLFGANSYTENNTCVPNTLKTVVVTNEKRISPHAFYECCYITSIMINEGVLTVGEGAFQGCNGLTSITLPNSIARIDINAFQGCNSLTNITVPFIGNTNTGTSNTHFGYIFGANSYTENGTYVPDSLKIVVITNATNIGDNAFRYCSNLTNISIFGSVTNIGLSSFGGCNSLTNVFLPDGLISIGDGAFSGCGNLKSVTIPESVSSIGAYAFYGVSLLNIYILPPISPQLGINAINSPDCTYYVHGSEYTSGLNDSWKTLLQNKTVIEMYSVANEEGITTLSPIISRNGKDYYESGTEVTLSHGDYPDYNFVGYSVNGTPIEGNTFTMPDEDITVNAMLSHIEPVFYRHALVLSGEIGVKFRISFPEGFDSTGCYMDFTASDGRHSIVTFDNAETINDSTDIYFTFFINALELAEDITATLHYGNDKTIEDHYSAMIYIQYVCENMATNESLVNLVTALHTYGYYLQNSGWTDDKDSHVAIPIPAKQLTYTDIASATNGVNDKGVTKDLGESGISRVKLSIMLNEMTVIKVLVKPADDSVIITTPGYTQVEIGNETYYQFETDGIGARNLGNNYTITIETNKGTATVTASVMSYVKIALNSGSLSEAKLFTLAAFYQYHIAANNY